MIPLAGYTYTKQVGTPGNFGSVFHARNDLTGVEVAIKHIDEALSPETLAAWEAEAKAMAACRHENLVEIHHAEVTPDGPALVMEYLPDGSVAGRFGNDPAPVATVVDIAVDTCWGLHRLHIEGLAHRDIKPANLLLSGQRVKLADFGLARIHGDPVDLVYVLHTPPEVRAGGPWSEVADIYALAASAWRLLWGDGACGRHDPDIGALAAQGLWPNRDQWPPYVHKRLRTVLRQGLHPDPAKRPQSAAVFRGQLEQARPLVDWSPAPDGWRGDGQTSTWHVSVGGHKGEFVVSTTRALRGGPRRVKDLCDRFPSEDEAEVFATKVMQGLAADGWN